MFYEYRPCELDCRHPLASFSQKFSDYTRVLLYKNYPCNKGTARVSMVLYMSSLFQ